jgi:colicin import membrane protein
MKIRNKGSKIINIGTTILMPDASMDINEATLKLPAIQAFIAKGLLETDESEAAFQKAVEEAAARKLAEEAEAKAKAEAEAKAKAEADAKAKAEAEAAAKKAAEDKAKADAAKKAAAAKAADENK